MGREVGRGGTVMGREVGRGWTMAERRWTDGKEMRKKKTIPCKVAWRKGDMWLDAEELEECKALDVWVV